MSKPQHAALVTHVPAGFSGWWCQRCECAVTLPEELGSPARCPKCRKPTAVWVPGNENPPPATDHPPLAAPHIKRASAASRAWFEHMHEHIEDPTLPADLNDRAKE